MPEVDLEQVRADTPACERVVHFNNAGASLMPTPVYDAVTRHLALERDIGGYEAERRAESAIRAFYDEFAALLSAAPDEIAYVENATRAWDMVFYGLDLRSGDRVLTHGSEYASNYLALMQRARRDGLEIDVVPSDAHGQVDVEAMASMVTPRTRLVAITHVPTQGALVNPAAAVGAVARRHGLFYLLDACQSVGQLPLDVDAIGCDALSGTGRKFLRGPRGTGFLYVRRASMAAVEPPFIDLHAATWTAPDAYEWQAGARRYENWESYVAGRVGLAAAVAYARRVGIEAIATRVTALAQRLRDGLAALPGVTVHDQGEQLCGITTFAVAGRSADAVAAGLGVDGFNVSVTTATSAQLDLGKRGLDSLVRASVHYFNSDDEVERFVDAVSRFP